MIALLLISIGLTIAAADFKAEVQCNIDADNRLNGLTDAQLQNLTVTNLQAGNSALKQRIQSATDNGISCYKGFYDVYFGAVGPILLPGPNQTALLNRTTTQSQRSDAIKQIADITQAYDCDNLYKPQYVDPTFFAANCTSLETYFTVHSLKFKPKLIAMEASLAAIVQGFKLRGNQAITDIFTTLRDTYIKAFGYVEQCAAKITDPALSCKNIKQFLFELDYLLHIYEVQSAAKIKESL